MFMVCQFFQFKTKPRSSRASSKHWQHAENYSPAGNLPWEFLFANTQFSVALVTTDPAHGSHTVEVLTWLLSTSYLHHDVLQTSV